MVTKPETPLQASPGHECDPARGRLHWIEKFLLAGFLLGVVAWGVRTELRSVYLSRRMGDFGCFARGAWAVRSGADLYAVTCDNGWHYNYPPLLAILLTPLADPPPGEDTAGMVPYAVSAAVWYLFSTSCLFLGVHQLASALEEASNDSGIRSQRRGCRRWWVLRIAPMLWCLWPIGSDLGKGQLNSVLLAILCFAIGAFIRRRSWRAGGWLALAICLKLIPAYLLLFPLWRRDGRCLAGCGLGLVLGLGLIPLAVLGPARFVELSETYARVTLGPGLGLSRDAVRDKELTGINATDNHSLIALIHNNAYTDPYDRPALGPPTRVSFMLIGVALTAATLWAVGRRRLETGIHTAFAFGAFMILMVILSPVNHLHYFVMVLPVVMACVSVSGRVWFPWVRLSFFMPLACFYIANVLARVPGFEVVRDRCLVTVPAAGLWLTALCCLRRLAWHEAENETNIDIAATRAAA
jgi:alpha-1,2-mannosyltransferase